MKYIKLDVPLVTEEQSLKLRIRILYQSKFFVEEMLVQLQIRILHRIFITYL